MVKSQRLMLSLLLPVLICLSQASLVNLNGGYLSVNGAVTASQMDVEVRYDANVQWFAIIFSPDEVSSDVHLFTLNSNPANPISVTDAYLDQNSYIQKDDVSNIQPSITGNTSSTTSGLYVSYNRDLNTGDPKDRRLYTNQIIRICFISSTVTFKGNGSEKNLPKVCSFMSMHQNLQYSEDRLIGNYAATGMFNGNNITIYATQGTEYYSVEPWLYLTIVNSQQGLSLFTPKWMGVGYGTSMINLDLTLIEAPGNVTVRDMFATGYSVPQDDTSYTVNQGANDVIKIAGGYDTSKYFISSFKRKYSTGDLNRDTSLPAGTNTFCFVHGSNLVMGSAVHTGLLCLSMNIKTLYEATFRAVTTNTTTKNSTSNKNANVLINYTKPTRTVKVSNYGSHLHYFMSVFLLVILLI